MTTPPTTTLPRFTLVYKVVDDYEIKADVFGATPGVHKPGVVWIHGGGLIFGSRTTPRPAFLAALLNAGITVISIDHRLAPETKLTDIVDDVHDAWRWVANQGPALFGVDPERLAVAGGSSGAYLTLMSGHVVEPRPRALAAFWGFGDITTPWETEPSDHYLTTMPLISREQAMEKLGVALSGRSGARVRSRLLLCVLPPTGAVADRGDRARSRSRAALVRRILSDPQRQARLSAQHSHSWHGRHRRAVSGVTEHGRATSRGSHRM